MPTVNIDLPEQARRGLARIGLDEAALAIIGAGDDLVESEKAFRQSGRLEAIRADAARVNATKEREERFNRAGVRQMNRALAQLEEAPNKIDQDVRRQIREAVGTQEFRDRLREARDLFEDNLVSADISGGEAEEVVGLWNEAQRTLEQEGFDGLLNRGREMARQVREARGRPNKGREPHSPLATWKYYIIAGALVIGVASIIACFVWFACSWVAPLLSFFGLNWINDMIKQGCAPIPESS